MIENEKFERHLRESNLSENTISSYMFAIKQYVYIPRPQIRVSAKIDQVFRLN